MMTWVSMVYMPGTGAAATRATVVLQSDLVSVEYTADLESNAQTMDLLQTDLTANIDTQTVVMTTTTEAKESHVGCNH